MGMGGVLTHVLMILRMCEAQGLAPRFRCTNTCYGARDGGADWFADLFVQQGDPAERGVPIRIASERGYEVLGGRITPITIAAAHELFHRHIALCPAAHAEADAAWAASGLTRPLGVHYRGTDKVLEARLVAEEAALAAIARALAAREHDGLMLATDEPGFEAAVRGAFPDRAILTYNRPEIVRAAGVPIHFSGGSGYWKGIDALVNMLLLARCETVVRTASYLSGWAKVLNPAQRSVMLNRLHTATYIFPDTQIEREAPAQDRVAGVRG